MKTSFKFKKYQLLGKEIVVGDKVEFELVDLEGTTKDFSDIEKITIFSVFPAINTKVCDLQTAYINQLAKFFPMFDFVAVSVDDIDVLKDWCGSHGIDNIKVFSDKPNYQFGMATGFLLEKLSILNRGIVVLNPENEVIYLERLTNIHNPVNFAQLESFLKNLA